MQEPEVQEPEVQEPEAQEPEAWLRGPLAGIHPLVMPVFFTYQMVREDLQRYLLPLTPGQVWQPRQGATIGFHVQHIAGSVDRITTYLMRESLTKLQLQTLAAEPFGVATADQLYQSLDDRLRSSEARLATIDPAAIYEARTVGRKALPTSVIGLIVHLAEHTQRHLGQTITLAKAARLAD